MSSTGRTSSSSLLTATDTTNLGAATGVRWRIMGMIMLIMAVTALNRLNLSIAGKTIEEEFSLNFGFSGGGGGIRTPETLSSLTVFKTGDCAPAPA